jgi:hypothetical protein
MGLAYGATEAGATGGARRIGVIVDEGGAVLDYRPRVDAAGYPAEALKFLQDR